MSFGQTLTDILNFCCDFDLERNNPFFPQDNPAYDAVLPTKFGCKRTSSSKDIVEIVIFCLYISPRCDLDIEDSEYFFLRNTLAHDAA